MTAFAHHMRPIIFLLILFLAISIHMQSYFEERDHLQALSFQEATKTYGELLNSKDFKNGLLYEDNREGRIVWNEAPLMESLVNMYEATGDPNYLDIFCEHADHVLSMRDDHAMRPDHTGRLRPGWQTGSYYTLGIPIIIPDAQGKPALEVQGIHRAGNNYTTIKIQADDVEHFSLLISNDFRRDEPIVVKFDGLTIETAEKIVNADMNPDSWVRMRVIGNRTPIQGEWILKETYPVVLQELHTPIIGISFLRFADLVFRNEGLIAYRKSAEEYVGAFEESANDYLNTSYRTDESGGFFIFDPDGKFWASGLSVPNNGLSANGRFFLWLYRDTGNVRYLEIATSLAKYVRAGMSFLPDGTMAMPYWPVGSLPYTGWNNALMNGLYSQLASNKAMEDVSHFSQTLNFMIEAQRMGVIFREEDLHAVARTFVKRLWKPSTTGNVCEPDPSKGFYLAHGLDGKGSAYDYASSAFALLSRYNPSIRGRVGMIYDARYKNMDCSDINSLGGQIMLGWSILALRDEPLAV